MALAFPETIHYANRPWRCVALETVCVWGGWCSCFTKEELIEETTKQTLNQVQGGRDPDQSVYNKTVFNPLKYVWMMHLEAESLSTTFSSAVWVSASVPLRMNCRQSPTWWKIWGQSLRWQVTPAQPRPKWKSRRNWSVCVSGWALLPLSTCACRYTVHTQYTTFYNYFPYFCL